MPKIRVLIVDDSVVIRKILTDALAEDPEIEVVGTAPNGRIALQKIPQVNPDLITLDIEMPELNGLDTLPLIRKDYPNLPVIMFSTLTARGANTTLEALARGASDYVSKPANVGSVTAAKDMIREELTQKIKGLVHTFRPAPVVPQRPAETAKSIPPSKGVGTANSRIDAITIGVSTGGPNALAALIPDLPADLGVPIFIVQHMPPMFTKLLAARLSAQSKLAVVEAAHGVEVQKNTIYIAPGDFHLEVVRSGTKIVTALHQGPQENSCRPAADVLFRSVGRVYGSHTLAIVLTGMGQDGLHGCECLRELGAEIIVQDKPTSVVWGMPGYVAQAGLADAVLPLDCIAQDILRRLTRSYRAGSKSAPTQPATPRIP